METSMVRRRIQDENKSEVEKESTWVTKYDIALIILQRLPLNTLIRLRCVCKSWNSITRELSFADQFLIHSHVRPNITSVLMFGKNSHNREFLFYRLDHKTGLARPINHLNKPEFERAKFTDSVNGLVCFEVDGKTYVCNLCTREIILLPSTELDLDIDSRSVKEIKCYNSLGYYAKDQKYMVLKTWKISTDGLYAVYRHKVLKLGTSVWKRVDSDTVKSDMDEFCWGGSVCFNGSIHAISYDGDGRMKIMAFNLANESFVMLSTPDSFSTHEQKANLVVYKDHLAVIDYAQLKPDFLIKLHILDDYKNRMWNKEDIVLPREYRYEATNVDGQFFIGMNRKGEILLAPNMASKALFIVSYDFEEQRLQKIKVKGLPNGRFIVAGAPIDYVESILSLRKLSS